MNNNKKLLEQRGDLLKANANLLENAQKEERTLTEAEGKTFDENETKIDSITATLDRQKRQSQRRATMVKINRGGEEGEKKAIRAKYRLSDAILNVANNQPLKGLELEMHQQARQEFTDLGVSPKGTLQMPALFMQREENVEIEKRSITVGGNGGNTVATDLGGLIGILRPNLVMEQMGATVITGLVGKIDMPNQSAKASGSWLAEVGANSESNPDFAKRSIEAHRLSTYSRFSRQLLAQSSLSMEQFVRQDLAMAIRENVEYGAIQGSGTGNTPTGILNTVGIGDVALGTNGAAPSYNKIIDLETAIKSANYNGEISYLSTPTMKGLLKKTQMFSGTNGSPVWSGNEMNGSPAYTTTQVPSTLTKGTSTDCHAILAGDFSQLMINQWGGTDFIIDPFTLADTGEIKITVNSFWDFFLRYVEAFAAIKDARNV